MTRLRKEDWRVADITPAQARDLVAKYHYSGGGSMTGVYFHGLFRVGDPEPQGVAHWLPPTRVAAESVNREAWQRVLSLTRLVVKPGVPSNACSFLMARSMKLITRDQRFVSLVTYADESQGHTGAIYLAAGWDYVGRTGPYPRWVEPLTGRQVATLATKSRTKAQMEALGYVNTGKFFKHKFVKHLPRLPQPGWKRQLGIL